MGNAFEVSRSAPARTLAARCANVERLESRVLLSAASTATIPGISVLPNAAPGSLDLNTFFTDNAVAAGDTLVLVQTTNGNIPLELFNSVTPNTVTNFLKYVNGGLYNGVIFHRTLSAFVDQGGGFKPDGSAITSFGTVINEPHFSNKRGTIAMAKTPNDPNSATNQWFINMSDNNAPNLDGQNGGFTVFGKVLYNGMTVADAINNLTTIDASSLNSAFTNLPVQNASAGAVPSNMVVMNTVSTVSPVSFSVTSDNSALVTPTLNPDGHTLALAYTPNQTGVAHITVTAHDLGGGTVSQTFLDNVGTFVAGAGGNKAVIVQQSDGTQVTVTVHGPGSASLSVSGTSLQQNTAKKGILVLSGTGVALASITTTGTTSATTVNVLTKGGTKLASLSGVTTDAAIGTFNGKAVDLSGNLAAGGAIKNLMLHGASGGTIAEGGGGVSTIKIGSAVTNESLNSASPIVNLQVPGWDGGNNTTSSIAAPSIGVFNVKGDLANTTIALNGTGTELKNLNVSGAINNVLLNASGNLGVITTGSMSGSHVFAGVGTLPAGQPLPNFATDFVANDSIKTVHVKNTFSNSNIAAESNGNLSLGKIQTTNGGLTFGVAGHTIAAVAGTDTTTSKKISLRKLAATTDSTSFEDFVVKIF